MGQSIKKQVKELRESEIIAKAIVEKAFPCITVERHETGREPNEYDFYLCRNGIIFGALEVTSTVDQNRKHLDSIIQRFLNPPHILIKRKWILYISDEFVNCDEFVRGRKARKKLIAKFDPYLADLEKEKIHRFFSDDAFERECVYRLCKDLHVEAGFSHPTRTPPRICFQNAGGGGDVSLEYFLGKIKEDAIKPDNIKKLANSGKHERHLFILIDLETDYLGWKIMRDLDPPQTEPQLPDVITTLWTATQISENEFIVWRVTPTNPWENLGKIKINNKGICLKPGCNHVLAHPTSPIH